MSGNLSHKPNTTLVRTHTVLKRKRERPKALIPLLSFYNENNNNHITSLFLSRELPSPKPFACFPISFPNHKQDKCMCCFETNSSSVKAN
jgi:hypothetical protein